MNENKKKRPLYIKPKITTKTFKSLFYQYKEDLMDGNLLACTQCGPCGTNACCCTICAPSCSCC